MRGEGAEGRYLQSRRGGAGCLPERWGVAAGKGRGKGVAAGRGERGLAYV